MVDKPRTALSINKDYLNISNPSAAQIAAQVRLLTRQVNWLLRNFLEELGDGSDT